MEKKRKSGNDKLKEKHKKLREEVAGKCENLKSYFSVNKKSESVELDSEKEACTSGKLFTPANTKQCTVVK